jgi:hypothetical protein
MKKVLPGENFQMFSMKLLQAGTWQARKIIIVIRAKEAMPSRTEVAALRFCQCTSGSREKLLFNEAAPI